MSTTKRCVDDICKKESIDSYSTNNTNVNGRASNAPRLPGNAFRVASGDMEDNDESASSPLARLSMTEKANDDSAEPTCQAEEAGRSVTTACSSFENARSSGAHAGEAGIDLDTANAAKHDATSSVGMSQNQTNLIVNYLPPYMSQDEVNALFSSIGTVDSCKLVREKTTGESLGYAFVNFRRACDAEKAIRTLNGLRLQNKTIKVSFARPSSESIKGANLYICGLPKRMTQLELEQLFGQYGTIITARILYDNKTGFSRGVAFIRFNHRQEAELAMMKLNGYRPPNTDYPKLPPNEAITVKFANSPASLKQDNLTSALLKHASSLAATPRASSSKSPVTDLSTLISPLQQLTERLRPRSSVGGRTDALLPGIMDPLLAPAVAASCGALTSSGWCIFVFGLAPETDESNLWQLFGPFGAVQSVKLVLDPVTKKCRGFCFVTMSNYEEALLAIHSLNGYAVGDRVLQVSFKTANCMKLRGFPNPAFGNELCGADESIVSGVRREGRRLRVGSKSLLKQETSEEAKESNSDEKDSQDPKATNV